MRILALAVAALLLLSGPAVASQCPLLIKQLNEAVGKMKADDPKAKQAKELIAKAQKLHDDKQHAESVKTCDEAAKVLGVTLQKKKS